MTDSQTDEQIDAALAAIRRDTRDRCLGAIAGLLVFAAFLGGGIFLEILGLPLARFPVGGIGVLVGYVLHGRISGRHLLFDKGGAPWWLGPTAVATAAIVILLAVGVWMSGPVSVSDGIPGMSAGDEARMAVDMQVETGPALSGDAAAALPTADILRGLALPATPRRTHTERRTYPDGSWSAHTASEPISASVQPPASDPILVTETRIYPDADAAAAGFEWYARSRGVELSWTDLEFEPPALEMAGGIRWNHAIGGRPGGGTEAVLALGQRGSVLVYAIIGNLSTVEPADFPIEGVVLPAVTRALDAGAALAGPQRLL